MARKGFAIVKSIIKKYRSGITIVYILNITAEIFYLLIPSSVGLLIDSLINGTGYGIIAFTITYLGWVGASVWRRIQSSMTFSHVFNTLCIQLIENHKDAGISTTKINARVELMKDVVQFIEWDLPFLVKSAISIVGSSILLYFYNPKLLLAAIIILIPSIIINTFFSKKLLLATRRSNDQFEGQIEVIQSGSTSDFQTFFQKSRSLHIKKSTLEASNFGLLEIFVFGMILMSIYIICKTDNMGYGSIAASYGIILRFAYGFDFIPITTTKVAIIRDVLTRIEESFKENTG